MNAITAPKMMSLAPSFAGAAACGFKSACADLDRPRSFCHWRLPVRLGWGHARCNYRCGACPNPCPPPEGGRATPNRLSNKPLALVILGQAVTVFIALAMSLMLLLMMTALQPSWAGPGHDQGDAPAAVAGTGSPRFTAHSDLFEAVGMLTGDELSITLDRYATNEPVLKANIELEAGSYKAVAIFHADHGDFSIPATAFKKPGTYAIVLTVTAGDQTDLLTGELVVPDLKASPLRDDHGRPWLRWLGYLAVTLLLVAIAAGLLRKRKANITLRSNATLLIAACALIMGATATNDACAGPGHDHGGEEAAAAGGGNAPKRQLDGSVFLPKTSQRQLLIRTELVEEKLLPKSIELTGRVVADANAGGKVQATQAGRIEAGPRGLPTLGQAVRKGEVLAVVRVSSSAIERANQQSQTSELRSNLELARKRVARLEQLEGTVPQKDIDAARLDVTSLQQRAAAVGGSVSAVESLMAPVSGVIAAASVVAGQVVDARELVFEIVDPSRLSVEASAFDAALIGNIAGASVATAQASVELQFLGAGRTLREGAIPLLFRTGAGKASLPLAIHQPVKVVVQTKELVKGFAVPTAAVIKNANNQDMVWVHTSAETFAPRTVRAAALSGSTVSVVDGLKAGDRVVTQGAPLINQVR